MASTAPHLKEPKAPLTQCQLLKVAYDYDYDYKTRKVSIRAGELLQLLQKTNQHWWKTIRPGENKPFFVPAQYVTEVGQEGDDHVHRALNKNGDKSLATKAHSLSLPNSTESPFLSRKNGESQEETALKGESSKSKRESSFFSFSKSGSKSNKINRNEGSRSSHRENREKGHNHSRQASSKISSSSSSSGKLKNWSASLENLASQIVFPGLGSESVADLTLATRRYEGRDHENFEPGSRHNNDRDAVSFERERSSFSSFHCDNRNQNVHSNSINKCLTFRNPTFNKGSGEILEIGNSNNDITGSSPQHETRSSSVNNMEADCTISRSVSGTITKESKLPETPLNSPIRKLAESDWEEHYTGERYFYYNNKTKITSWKPPRFSSTRKSDDEHLGSSLSDGSANASSFEKSLENIPDLVGSPNLSEISAEKASNSFSDNDNGSNTVMIKGSSGERSRSSESILSIKEDDEEKELCQANPVEEIPIPEGWERKWDQAMQQFCYINNKGARWFASTDSQARVYYYEENSSNSSWFLPSPQSQLPAASPTDLAVTSSREEIDTSHGKTPESSRPLPPVKKRHSAGEPTDRSLKTKSLLISSDLRKQEFDKSSSLPRFVKSIWCNGKLNVQREGPIARSKITENGKKLRKSWGVVFAVLTDSHLSLFKDQKSYLALTKTELEIELSGASVEWTEEKSSRKNVFQLSTLSDQMLFQLEDKDLAQAWFEDIKQVTEKDSTLDISMRLRSAESPDSLLDSSVGERKISSRLNRNKSTKLRITTVDDKEKVKIKDHLKKFFSRRPNRESLVKKGIIEDESVFGCSLEKLCALEKGDVPRFVQECIVAIEAREENLKTDGLYRASGNLSQVQKIRLKVDQNNMACLFQEEDVHVLAGCLKLFFRELKEPLIPPQLFEKALQACRAPTKKEKVSRLRDIAHSLTKPNRCTLQALLSHLAKVAAYAEFNRMQINNLAIVFGPTLMYAPESQNMATDLMQQNLVIEAFLVDYESIFQQQ